MEINEISELCKLLNNPFKRKMLVRIFTARDGISVGLLADEMRQLGLALSGVSQYLKQLQRIGVIHRSRAGRYVNYFPDMKNASSKVRMAVEALFEKIAKKDNGQYDAVFSALMNPFRARVVAALAQAGSIPAIEICAKAEHQIRYLKRDLLAAEKAGLIATDDSETTLAVYHYLNPKDSFVKLLVSLC